MPSNYIKKLNAEGHGSLSELESKWDEAKKAAGPDASYALVTHIFKKMVGVESALVTAEELFQLPNSMSSQTAASKDQSVLSTLQAMATYYDPDFSKDPNVKISGAKLCHRDVVESIKQRGVASDKIWLFGLDQKAVAHSLLSTEANRVVTDAWKAKGGQFKGTRGYVVRPHGTYPYVGVISVEDWFDEFFDFSVER